MAELVFDCVGAAAERYAATPSFTLRLRITETSGETDRRDRAALPDPHRTAPPPLLRRGGRTAARPVRRHRPLGGHRQTAAVLHAVRHGARVHRLPPTVDLPVPVTYDLEIASTKYFHALTDGVVPLLLLFSGTVFTHRRRPAVGAAGAVEQGDVFRAAGRGVAGDGGRALPEQRVAAGAQGHRWTPSAASSPARAAHVGRRGRCPARQGRSTRRWRGHDRSSRQGRGARHRDRRRRPVVARHQALPRDTRDVTWSR